MSIFHLATDAFILDSLADLYIPQTTSERKRASPRATLNVANRMNLALWVLM